MCTTNVHINYDFIFSKGLNNLFYLCINWANMWYPDYRNKKLNFCKLNSFKDFYLCIKWSNMWYLDNQLRKKLNLFILLQVNKNPLCKNQMRIQNMYYQFKYEQLHIFAKTAVIKLLKLWQLIIYKSLRNCQLQCLKFKPHLKPLFFWIFFNLMLHKLQSVLSNYFTVNKVLLNQNSRYHIIRRQ